MGVDLDAVRDQRAYLIRITTRQALIRLRTLGRRKESYVGPWLPEPLLTAPDVAEYDEIAEAVDKSPAAVRQIASRARAHVAARRPREVVSPAEARGALDAFQRAVETGDLQSLLDILAPDAVLVGMAAESSRPCARPIVGADKVARLLAVAFGRPRGEMSVEPAEVNGCPALILRLNGEIDTVVAVRIDDGLITGLYGVRNPDKLSRMERETPLCR